MACALLFLAGCKSSSSTSAMAFPDGSVESTPTEAQGRKYSETITVYGPLSEEKIQSHYGGVVTNVGLAHPATGQAQPVAATIPPPLPYEAAAASPAWEVPLGRTWNYIVIHHSASERGSAAAFDKEHKSRGWDGLGYDFVIGNGTLTGDGEVEVGYRWKQQMRGAHAGNMDYNEHGVGICLVGNFEYTYATARQMASLRQLVRFLQARCRIPTSQIIGHHDVPGKETQCPGAHFDLAAFKASLGGAATAASASAALPPGRVARRYSGAGVP